MREFLKRRSRGPAVWLAAPAVGALAVAALVAAASIVFVGPAAAAKKDAVTGPQLAKLPATVEKLANGMKVILVEDHSVPVVSRYTCYRVGGRNERPGITGISHFIEHMMFNGAEKYGPKEFDRILESNGGYSNAYTSEDVTAYYEDCASGVLELCLDLDSDRMRSLALKAEIVETELGVVREERRLSVDNSVDGTMWEELAALAYKAHPYGWGVIGWMSDLESITRDDAVTYWKSYYAPNNAVLVIVGDFDTKKTLELVHKYYDGIPAQPPVPPVRTKEPEQAGERRGELHKSAEMPGILVGYHIPDVKSPDIYALDILQIVLADGESSRLYKKLVRDLGIAVYAQANAEWKIDPGLFTFDVKMKPGENPADGEKALYEEIASVASNGIAPAELEKAKNRVLAQFFGGMQTVNGKAGRIGRYEIFFGDFNEIYKVQERYQAVTLDDVKRVAAEYFKQTNRSVMTLIPEA